MRICQFTTGTDANPRFGVITDDLVVDVAAAGGPASLREALTLDREAMMTALASAASSGAGVPLSSVTLAAPIDAQEVWAAGVTYLRSRNARMEESSQRDVYDRVYDADRPEIFLKATPSRVVGPNGAVGIRSDSGWDVPEPELALLVNAGGEVVGFTIGNDVSSRSIEGENPLYLPQAKVYAQCAGLGPVVVLTDEIGDPGNLPIKLEIRRGGEVLFAEETATSRMHRTFDDLVSYLFRGNAFPAGVFLMTGTGIVPPSEFTLQDGDMVTITIEPIGALTNPVDRIEV
ncbi:MAG: fumarylacetoacetate hydrolase family protein [Thermomicrobiales bacterium]|nr:fumarylacetoacetate hydrolase family protein [Thermomicrobiales bacterium]